MNLAPEVRRILRRESSRRGVSMTSLLESAVRSAYSPKRPSTRRRLVRENGYLVVAAIPGAKPITDARIKDILHDLEW